MMPIRERIVGLNKHEKRKVPLNQFDNAVTMAHLEKALTNVKKTVQPETLIKYRD